MNYSKIDFNHTTTKVSHHHFYGVAIDMFDAATLYSVNKSARKTCFLCNHKFLDTELLSMLYSDKSTCTNQLVCHDCAVKVKSKSTEPESEVTT